jgi:hypothetical protein
MAYDPSLDVKHSDAHRAAVRASTARSNWEDKANRGVGRLTTSEFKKKISAAQTREDRAWEKFRKIDEARGKWEPAPEAPPETSPARWTLPETRTARLLRERMEKAFPGGEDKGTQYAGYYVSRGGLPPTYIAHPTPEDEWPSSTRLNASRYSGMRSLPPSYIAAVDDRFQTWDREHGGRLPVDAAAEAARVTRAEEAAAAAERQQLFQQHAAAAALDAAELADARTVGAQFAAEWQRHQPREQVQMFEPLQLGLFEGKPKVFRR